MRRRKKKGPPVVHQFTVKRHYTPRDGYTPVVRDLLKKGEIVMMLIRKDNNLETLFFVAPTKDMLHGIAQHLGIWSDRMPVSAEQAQVWQGMTIEGRRVQFLDRLEDDRA